MLLEDANGAGALLHRHVSMAAVALYSAVECSPEVPLSLMLRYLNHVFTEVSFLSILPTDDLATSGLRDHREKHCT